MRIKKKRKFLTSMILDDLIHTKLVQALIELDLRGDRYFNDIGDKVIKLMGFKNVRQNEIVFNHYQKLLERSKHVSLEKNNADMLQLAKEIYQELKKQKPLSKKL